MLGAHATSGRGGRVRSHFSFLRERKIKVLPPSRPAESKAPPDCGGQRTDGFASLRRSHGRANSPPDCLLGPAFRIRPQRQKVQHQMVLDFLWWGRTDSNHRSDTQQIYSLSPLATRELPHIFFFRLGGAGRRTRTPDLLITNQLLYRLSYTGELSNRTRLL